MKILVVEDDFVSRKIMSTLLSEHGDCDTAVNGIEAMRAYKLSLKEKKPYDLICLDIMMPEMDGQQVLKEIRNLEKEKGILGLDGVKIIMVTALGDMQNVRSAFREQCEAYLVKPIEAKKLFKTIEDLGFKLTVKG